MKKLKCIERKAFTVSQANFDGWLVIIQRNLQEAKLLIQKTEEYFGAVKEFALINKR